ncbi:MAG: polyribonucleotide nucleotidyltransferase [Dehalococcoidia bacterium]|nr:polyribonucleotide nucleotidyltransferase [Dehalococcoidia bacterium]
MEHVFERNIGGKPLTVSTGKLAFQAGGAVTVQYGETIVLVTACVSPQPRAGVDFLPLTVDYEERLYAAGKIPGGFLRREGRPSQEATLTARLTDRSIRPLFPKGFRNDVQVVVTVLSADQENDPDILTIIGASCALAISDIPFSEPISAVRVGLIGDRFCINPTYNDLQKSLLDLVVAGTASAIVMVEAGSIEVSEHQVLEAVKFGQEVNQEIIALQHELISACGQPKKPIEDKRIESGTASAIAGKMQDIVQDMMSVVAKSEREEELASRKEELVERIGDEFSTDDIMAVFQSEIKKEIRSRILEQGVRPDGRAPTEIRPISCEVGVLPRTHGSGLFTRGQTQVLTIATLGSSRDEQIVDSLSLDERKRFLHHYNFPPFSTGESRRLGGPGRREIGHGALAERALSYMIPAKEDFPYTIRLVSEVLSSNGSTSMGSVCGSTLALMDAGVPIKAPVAGIAMGLIMGESGKYVVLTDIAGLEDAMGDMDFKVAGTAKGITALQMDIKMLGISYEIIEAALAQARDARLFIMDKMLGAISASRVEVSKYAPRMLKIKIDPEKIRFVIGPGGKTIRSIQDETKVSIDVEEDGTVIIGSSSDEMAQKAIRMIEALTRDVEVGGIYTGKVTRITNFGAFVELMPGKDGLVHISELEDYRVNSVEDVVQLGDEITVIVTEIDRMGRINLSRRAVLQGQMEPPAGGPRDDSPRPMPPRNDIRNDSGLQRRPEPPPGMRGPRPMGNGGRPSGPERRPDSRPPMRRTPPPIDRRGRPPGPGQ